VSETIRNKNLEDKKKSDEKEREKIIEGIRSGKIPRKDIYLKKKREKDAMNKAFVVEEDSKTVSSESAESDSEQPSIKDFFKVSPKISK